MKVLLSQGSASSAVWKPKEAVPQILPSAGLGWTHACSGLCWRDRSSLTPDQRVLKLPGEEYWSEEWPLSVLNWSPGPQRPLWRSQWSSLRGLRTSLRGSTHGDDPWLFGACTWPSLLPCHSPPFLPSALLACVWVYFTLFTSYICLSFTDFSMSPQQTGAK